MTLHLIHLPIDLRALHAWGEARGVGKGIFDEGLALHHLLGETFGAAVLQPFRLMVAPRAQRRALRLCRAVSRGSGNNGADHHRPRRQCRHRV